jgi:hypothetical protein
LEHLAVFIWVLQQSAAKRYEPFAAFSLTEANGENEVSAHSLEQKAGQ